jgi:Stress responsive A/B Barrel Domain
VLTHIVLMNLTAEAPPGQAAKIVAALRSLPAAIPAIKEYRVGPDLGLAEGNYDLGLVATFDDQASFVTYRDAPVHQAVIAELIRPVLAQRTAIQFES